MNSNAFFSGLRRTTAFNLLLVLAVCLLVFVTRSVRAQTYSILYTFNNGNDGAEPLGDLLRDAKGNLYGTTLLGGGYSYQGTVFKLSRRDKEAVLYSFLEGYGALPRAGLVSDGHGTFYGTTSEGGAYGQGTVFKLDTKGNESVLHSFTGGDGYYPEADLVRDEFGNLYGTTFGGGNSHCEYGCGTVFKVSKTGRTTQLYEFTFGTDGYWPNGLTRDKSGNLYGTALWGGDSQCLDGWGCGTVFKIDAGGHFTVLYAFTGTGGDAEAPAGAPVLDGFGNLYGVAGGGIAGYGTVFKVDPNGNETVLYSFAGPPGDGMYPHSLSRDAKGNFYGTTYEGGSSGYGIVFMLDPTGKETVLHNFTGTNGDGAYPEGGMALDASGNLFGTTGNGGDLNCGVEYGCGIVFELTP
jgi:uncharacterized repeat protein (TIGR03803 family)